MNALSAKIVSSSLDLETLHQNAKKDGYKYVHPSGDNYSIVCTHKTPADLVAAAMNHAKHAAGKEKARVRLLNKLSSKKGAVIQNF
jgi:hypothetical protein